MTRCLFDAVLLDLDGVLTSTTALHASAWQRTFEEALDEPFDDDRDYFLHVDGKPREDCVRDFLLSRGRDPEPAIVHALGERKQALVERALEADGVEPYPGSVAWVEHLRAHDVRTAVVSSSANAGAVLAAVGIDEHFDAIVDGGEAKRLELAGKPAPDGFLEGARRLSVAPRRAVVVEDALAGVAAGRAGLFGLVIGVARGVAPSDLYRAGADVVVADLEELVP